MGGVPVNDLSPSAFELLRDNMRSQKSFPVTLTRMVDGAVVEATVISSADQPYDQVIRSMIASVDRRGGCLEIMRGVVEA